MVKNEILFRLSRPYKISTTVSASKVVLPGVKGNITILPERAPTLILLGCGLLQVLDKNNEPQQRYFIKNGVADVARNRCAVSSEKVVDLNKITLERAVEKRDQALHQDDKDFYQMIIDTFAQIKK